jgi:hypothetical protein
MEEMGMEMRYLEAILKRSGPDVGCRAIEDEEETKIDIFITEHITNRLNSANMSTLSR